MTKRTPSWDADDVWDAKAFGHLSRWLTSGALAHTHAVNGYGQAMDAGWCGWRRTTLGITNMRECIGVFARQDDAYCADERFLDSVVLPKLTSPVIPLPHSRPECGYGQQDMRWCLGMPQCPVHVTDRISV